jgi:heavy metal sensor kinase
VTRLAHIPIRWRLALAFAVAMAALLAATGAFLHARLASSLDQAIDDGLRARSAAVVAFVRQSDVDAGGRLDLAGQGDSFAQIVDARGDVVDATPAPGRVRLLSPEEVRRSLVHQILVDHDEVPGSDAAARLLASPVRRAGAAPLVVVVGTSLESRDEALDGLVVALLIGGPLALALASAGGYLLAALALRPVESMRRQASEISATDTGTRLPVPPADDEIRRLGETLNEMLGRLETALEHERRFVADASHELRTPLGMLRTELELALRRERSREELRAALVSASEETDRLARLAEDLLVLARADRGRLPLRVRQLGVGKLLEDVRHRYAAQAAEAGREIVVGPVDRVEVGADATRLEQALGNLVDNALRYGQGPIGLEAVTRDGVLELHVVDRGPGLPADFVPRAFERFSRADEARTGPGSGLGLAIVQVIARAHGGEAGAAIRPDGGADVWVALPLSPSG